MVFPRSMGTFFTSLVDISKKDSAVSRIVKISFSDNDSISRRCSWRKGTGRLLSIIDGFGNQHLIGFVDFLEMDLDDFSLGCGKKFSHIISPDGKFTVTAID